VRATAALFVGVLLCQPWSLAAQREVVFAIQVHGNTLTSTDDVIRASGIAIGDRVATATLSDAEARLRAALEPEEVEVLKRFASISDPTRVLVLIQLDEGPVRVDRPDADGAIPEAGALPAPRATAVRRSRVNVMLVPILGAEDGYGLTYGAQVAFAGHRSARRRRIVVPASWGGDKRLAAEYQQEFARRLAPGLRAGGMLQRRTHPFYQEHADRRRAWARAEWPLLRAVRAGSEAAWQSSSLGSQDVEARSLGVDAVVDTRIDPLMPYNAVFVRSAVERIRFSADASAVRTEIDANAYIGLYRGTVLALRAVRENSAARRRRSTRPFSAARGTFADSRPDVPWVIRLRRRLWKCVSRRPRRSKWRGSATASSSMPARPTIKVSGLRISNWRRAWAPECGLPLPSFA
jgi:hypothetical protein